MDWNVLWSDLRSEAIGIVLTVFLVDRLIKWREQRAWRRVRETFLEQAQFVTDNMWAAFEEWFEAIQTAAEPGRTGWQHVGDFTAWRANAECVLGTYNELFSRADRGTVTDEQLRDTRKRLTGQIANGFLPRPLSAHRSSITFHKVVFPLLQRFDALFARYTSVVDPDLSLITIRIRRDLDLLDTLWRVPPENDDRDLQDRLTGLVVSQLLELARLTRYVRTHRTGVTSVWHPRDE
jgi:hypothetical protein